MAAGALPQRETCTILSTKDTCALSPDRGALMAFVRLIVRYYRSMSDQQRRPEPPEQSPSAPGKALPWLESGEGSDALAELQAYVCAALREVPVAGTSRGGLLRMAQ